MVIVNRISADISLENYDPRRQVPLSGSCIDVGIEDVQGYPQTGGEILDPVGELKLVLAHPR